VGEKLLPVKVEAPFGVQVVKCDPEQIKVDIDRVAEKKVPVRVLVRGKQLQGLHTGTLKLSQMRLQSKAPAALLVRYRMCRPFWN